MKYKKINSLKVYNAYCNRHEQLMIEENDKFQDEIELLEILIEEYDNRVLKNKFEVLNPVELLRSILKDAQMTQNELAISLKVSRQLVSDILNYRRNISKELVIKLSNHFSMSQEAFSRPYQLNKRQSKTTKNVSPRKKYKLEREEKTDLLVREPKGTDQYKKKKKSPKK